MQSLQNVFTARADEFDGPVLVTGAGGCIGSWVLAILGRASVPVVVFDRVDDRRRPGLLLTDDEVQALDWVTGDIADTDAVKAVVRDRGVRAIIHLAALQVPFCKADPVAGASVNVVGTVNVLEAAREQGLRRVAYASSIAAHGVDESQGWLATLYGAYKHCNEQTARVYHQDWGVPSTGLRPGVVYGVGRDQGMSSKTTVAALAAVAGESYTVPFRGPTSWLYAGEVASAFVRCVALERDEARVFDCNGVGSTVESGLDIIRTRVQGARVEAGGEPLPFPADLSDDPLRAYVGDYGSLTLEEGLDETIEAFSRLLPAGKVTFAGE